MAWLLLYPEAGMALQLDHSLAFRPSPAAAEREPAPARDAAAAFARALGGATSPAAGAPLAGARHVPPARTPLSGSQAADALEAAWQGAVGRPPSPDTLSILVGQWAHETGRGSAMLNYNFGGIKGTGPSGASTVYRTREGSGASEVQIRDRFRAYDTAEQGASDFLGLLERRYPEALQAAERGDPIGFVQALKSRGYFTGDEGAYARSVAALAQRALAAGFDAVGAAPAQASEPLPAPATATPVGAVAAPLAAVSPRELAQSLAVAAPGAYAAAFADEISRVELLISALRIGEPGERDG